jgi:hypothetical protein
MNTGIQIHSSATPTLRSEERKGRVGRWEYGNRKDRRGVAIAPLLLPLLYLYRGEGSR